MQARIARHRALRDPAWRTLEAPLDLPEALAGILAGIFAFFVAVPIIHLRGDYLLVVTIGIVEILRVKHTAQMP